MNENNLTILSNMYCTALKETAEKIKQISITENNVIEELTAAGIPFTWETVNDYGINTDIRILEIRVYLPGNILYGRTSYGLNDVNIAHKKAIYDAMKCLIPINSNVVKETHVVIQQPTEKPIQQSNITQALSPDEIFNLVEQASTKDASAKEFEKIAEAERNGVPTEVPFDESDTSELDQILSGTSTSAPAQQSGPMGFSQEQIQSMVSFKQKFNITNDEMLGTYINAWNNKLSKKEDLTSDNISAFLKWAEQLGKAPY